MADAVKCVVFAQYIVKSYVQTDAVTADCRGRKAEADSVGKIIENFAVGGRGTMMSLVNNNGIDAVRVIRIEASDFHKIF